MADLRPHTQQEGVVCEAERSGLCPRGKDVLCQKVQAQQATSRCHGQHRCSSTKPAAAAPTTRFTLQHINHVRQNGDRRECTAASVSSGNADGINMVFAHMILYEAQHNGPE